MVFSVVLNLIPLVLYKYGAWITQGTLFTQLILPLGISFYTFQQIGFLVDSYRRTTQSKGLLAYSCYVCFFPQLIAGPIVNHRHTAAQYDQLHIKNVTWDEYALGLHLFIVGLIKKTLIADNLAPIANKAFSNAESLSTLDAWLGSFAYSFQLYFDFSGYSDMAIGLGLMFGFSLPFNFNAPYVATSVPSGNRLAR